MNIASSFALIPARGGSKRLPDKALRTVGGKTLLARTIETVRESACFDRIVVSSDSERILEHALAYPGIEVRQRPRALASDEATTMDVLVDLLESIERHPLRAESQTGAPADDVDSASMVGLFQPTSPFRTGEDVSSAVHMLVHGVDAVVSIVEAPVSLERTFRFDEGTRRCLLGPESGLLKGRTRKQTYEPLYVPNGAVYLSRASWLRARRSFFEGNVLGYLMPRDRSLDIDDEYDLMFAEFLASIRSRPA